jgi:peptidoglycan/LPS O-acetylase OafA/YrhL
MATGAPPTLSRSRPGPDPSSTADRYVPALDGIRGLAVLAVLAFHLGAPWAPGGFLGVSVFFTLSGFLITRLLLREAAGTGTIVLVAFWARRLRRLLPAALLTIGLVLVFATVSPTVAPDALRGDVLASLGYVANWRFLAAGHSYADLFRAPSPLLHFWSLAIEEQFYLLFPIVVWLVLRARPGGAGSTRRLRVVLIIGVAASIAVGVVAGRAGDADFVYYSLPTRAAELLAGALLATSVGAARLVGRRAPAWVTAAGFAGLAALVLACVTTTRTSGWIVEGGLPLFALVSVGLVLAALAYGPFAAMLAVAPLRGLGLVSYGVYLYHWPVVQWLTPGRVGFDGVALAAVRVGVTLAIAVASYLLVELPVRRGHLMRGTVARIAAPVCIAAVALAGFFVTSSLTAPPSVDVASAARSLAEATASAPPPPDSEALPLPTVSGLAGSAAAPVPTFVPTPGVAPRVAFFGDSTALMTAQGVQRWAARTDELAVVGGAAYYGCGILREGPTRLGDRVAPPPSACGGLEEQWSAAADQSRPDIAVIQVGPIEVDDHVLAGDSEWRAVGDPVYDARLEAQMLAGVDALLARGVTPVWLTSPPIDHPHLEPRPPSDDPVRMERLNEIVHAVARRRPGLRVVDLAGWVTTRPGGVFDPVLRPDSVHFDEDAAAVSVAPWLAPAVVQAATTAP